MMRSNTPDVLPDCMHLVFKIRSSRVAVSDVSSLYIPRHGPVLLDLIELSPGMVVLQLVHVPLDVFQDTGKAPVTTRHHREHRVWHLPG